MAFYCFTLCLYVVTTKPVAGVGLDLGVARGLGVSSPAMHGMPQLHEHKNQWVTVFGYPMGAGAEVLRHFQAWRRSPPASLRARYVSYQFIRSALNDCA